jgi:signal transduction histidine kinase
LPLAPSAEANFKLGWESDSAIAMWMRELATATDTARVIALNKLCWKLRRNNVMKSLEYGQQALELARRLRYKLGEAKALNFMGVVYRNMGEYGRAMDMFFEARHVAEEGGIMLELAYAYNNIAAVYAQRRNASQAVQALGISRTMFAQIRDTIGAAYCDLLDGDIAQSQGRYAGAIALYTRALQAWRQQGDMSQVSVCCVSIAQVYRAEQRYSLAIATLNQALFLVDKQPVLAAVIDNNLAETYLQMHNYGQAITFAELAVQLARAATATQTVANATQVLARSHALLGQFEQAYNYQQLYATAAAQLRSEEVQEKIAAAQMNYTLAKQESQMLAMSNDREKTRILLIASVVGSVLLLGLVFLLVRSIGVHRRTNTEIVRQQQMLEEQATQIELANAQLHEKNLALDAANTELVENNRQLETYLKLLTDANSKVQYQMSLQEQQALQVQIANAQLAEKNAQVEQAMKRLKETESQLVQSERTNAMGLLTAGVMHEINNPNAAVYAATGALKRKLHEAREYFLSLLDEADRSSPAALGLVTLLGEAEHTVSVAREGAERVGAIVNKLQNFTKHQRDGLRRGNLAEELSSTIELFRFQFKNVDVRTNLGTNRPQGQALALNANFGELNQVFFNFFVNAAQSGATRIHVEAERVMLPSGHACVRVCVHDDGCGIGSELREKIFEPFFTTKGVGNTGLGLSISKNVIERHGGVIAVRSGVDAARSAKGNGNDIVTNQTGTTFEVLLPAAQMG